MGDHCVMLVYKIMHLLYGEILPEASIVVVVTPAIMKDWVSWYISSLLILRNAHLSKIIW